MLTHRAGPLIAAFALAVATACDGGTHGAPNAPQRAAARAAALAGDATDPIAITAPVTDSASLATNTSRHYRLTVPASHSGLRVALACSASADLIVRRDSATSTIRDARYNGPLHTLLFTPEATQADDQWYVEVHADAATDCTLRADPVYARALTWDDGATPTGAALAAPDAVGGDYVFAVITRLSTWGAWRTLLAVTAGEADVYLQQGVVPSNGSYNSVRSGSASRPPSPAPPAAPSPSPSTAATMTVSPGRPTWSTSRSIRSPGRSLSRPRAAPPTSMCVATRCRTPRTTTASQRRAAPSRIASPRSRPT